jgi:hypothetical protein
MSRAGLSSFFQAGAPKQPAVAARSECRSRSRRDKLDGNRPPEAKLTTHALVVESRRARFQALADVVFSIPTPPTWQERYLS